MIDPRTVLDYERQCTESLPDIVAAYPTNTPVYLAAVQAISSLKNLHSQLACAQAETEQNTLPFFFDDIHQKKGQTPLEPMPISDLD